MHHHETFYPRIFFGGGDLFSDRWLAEFDGLLAFVYGGFSPLHSEASFAVADNRIPYPHILYGIDTSNRLKPTLARVPGMVWRGLDELTAKGCRRIGFHGAETTNAYYVDGARTCLRAICEWMEAHPDKIDSITLVDAGDDYFRRFGKAEFLAKRGVITLEATNPFEHYFEYEFPKELRRVFKTHRGIDFPYQPEMTATFGNQASALPERFRKTFFSVAAFYTFLIPQALTKVTEKMDAMYAFARCAGWPLCTCGLGGFMSPLTIMTESGLLPEGADIESWIRIARKELSYFCEITGNILKTNLWNPVRPAYQDLRELTHAHIPAIRDEISRQVEEYAAHFQEGRSLDNYYIHEEDLIH